jgi:hypothetical protein
MSVLSCKFSLRLVLLRSAPQTGEASEKPPVAAKIFFDFDN